MNTMKLTVFCDVTPCFVVYRYQRFGGTCGHEDKGIRFLECDGTYKPNHKASSVHTHFYLRSYLIYGIAKTRSTYITVQSVYIMWIFSILLNGDNMGFDLTRCFFPGGIIFGGRRMGIYVSSKINNCIFWNATPCNPLKVNRRFGATCRLHHKG
jgi:hypothetical protein